MGRRQAQRADFEAFLESRTVQPRPTGQPKLIGQRLRYVALSDHADYNALLRYVELAQPSKVLLNHGWKDFAWRLKRLGVDATYLEANEQLALF